MHRLFGIKNGFESGTLRDSCIINYIKSQTLELRVEKWIASIYVRICITNLAEKVKKTQILKSGFFVLIERKSLTCTLEINFV